MRRGAKLYLLPIIIAVAGCGSIERFAPPGIVKYEEIAGDQPMNAAIKERAAVRKEQHGATFPNLSEAPQAAPAAMPAAEQDAELARLNDLNAELNAAIARDLELSMAERALYFDLPGVAAPTTTIEEARDALAKAVEADDKAARAERGLPPRPTLEPEPE